MPKEDVERTVPTKLSWWSRIVRLMPDGAQPGEIAFVSPLLRRMGFVLATYLIGFGSLLWFIPGPLGSKLLVSLANFTFAYVALRATRVGVYVSSGGVRIVDDYRHKAVRWDQVDRFSLEGWDERFPALLLKKGESIRIPLPFHSLASALTFGRWSAKAWHRYIDEMNVALNRCRSVVEFPAGGQPDDA